MNLRVAMEVLNRYESHLLNTAEQAVAFVEEVGLVNVGILLDAFHMNLEEPDPARALSAAGERLFLFHAADSNRRGVGRGHTDFSGLFRALHEIGYPGDVIVECTAPGPDPFTPVKGGAWKEVLNEDVRASLQSLRRMTAPA
jgi:sugar phosphate isomerase/epimerase